MSDKNFKVKNGIDANGTISISSTSDSSSNLVLTEKVSTRTNLVLNPAFVASDTTGWGSYFASTNTIQTDNTAPYSTKVLQVQIPKTGNRNGVIWQTTDVLSANTPYSVSLYIKGPSGVQVASFSARPSNVDGSYLGEGGSNAPFTFDGTWQKIYLTSTPTVNYRPGFQIYIEDAQHAGVLNFYIHGVVVESGSTTNLPYFDGSQNAYASKYRATTTWAGTANASKSTVTYISQTSNAFEVNGNSSTIAKIDSYGNITANDLTLDGNLTVNGTTTNLNSTNLIIEDKNIIIADVATPTDTTADGAGITVKGATDKTFSWSNSTKSFISSEPLIINSTYSTTVGLIVQAATGQTSTNIFEVQRAGGGDPSFTVSHNYINLNRNTTAAASLTVYGANSGAVPLYVIGRSSQSVDLQQWQNSSGQVRASISSTGGLSLNYANSIKLYNTANTDYAQLWMDNGSGGTNLYVKTNYPVLMGDVGVDTGASLTVATQSTGQVGQVIRAKASQTADLQQWQDSAGSVLTKITSVGTLRVPIITDAAATGSLIYMNTTNINIDTRTATNIGLIINGVASQTANLQEWRNSAGTVLSKIDSSGNIIAGYAVASLIGGGGRAVIDPYGAIYTADTLTVGSTNGAFRFAAGGITLLHGGTTTDITLGIKGGVSQTGDLIQARNSSDAVLAKLSSDGMLVVGNTTGTVQIKSSGISGSYPSTGAGIELVAGFDSGRDGIQAYNRDTNAWRYLSILSAGTLFKSTFASSTPINIQGTASQTGDLTQWQNSAGTVLSNITADGWFETNNGNGIRFYGPSRTAWSTLANNLGNLGFNYAFTVGNSGLGANLGTLTSYAISASTIGLVVRGAASQTANLQEWQDSTGTVIAKVTSGGSFTSYNTNFFARTFFLQDGSTNASTQISGAYFTASAANSAIYARTTSASIVPLVVQGTTSQTADLQQWQDSSGTVLTTIDSSGKFVIGRGSQLASAIFTVQGNTSTYSPDNTSALANRIIFLRGNTNGNLMALASKGDAAQGVAALAITNGGFSTEIIGFGYNGNIYTNIQSASTVGLTVKGAASQTADLQQWQNSAGTVLASLSPAISSIVTLKFTEAYSWNINWGNRPILSTASAYLTITPYDDSRIALIVKGYASQTANLQEWQNSAGTVLARIDNNGNAIFIDKTVYANQVYIGNGNYLNATMHNVSGGAAEMRLLLRGHGSQTASIQEWQNSSGTALAKVDANGNFSAISKSFDIAHPTKENMRLRYASLEGPENGVYIRGTVESNIIELPEYWTGLVHEDSITVSLTAFGSAQNIYVEKIEDNKVYIGGELTKAFFTVYGERKDIDKLTVEY